jgi:hypothetical protein
MHSALVFSCTITSAGSPVHVFDLRFSIHNVFIVFYAFTTELMITIAMDVATTTDTTIAATAIYRHRAMLSLRLYVPWWSARDAVNIDTKSTRD